MMHSLNEENRELHSVPWIVGIAHGHNFGTDFLSVIEQMTYDRIVDTRDIAERLSLPIQPDSPMVIGIVGFAHQIQCGTDNQQRPDGLASVILETRNRGALKFNLGGRGSLCGWYNNTDANHGGNAFQK